MPRVRTLLILGALLPTAGGLAACSSGPRDPMENLSPDRSTAPSRSSAGGGSTRSGGSSAELRPAVVVNGQPVSWEDVWEPMAEYSGGVVVGEVALDTLLAAEMSRRGVTIGAAEVERERAALNRTIVEGVGVGDAEAQQLVRQVSLSRALGPHRMEALLRRNAMLRVIARENVNLTDEILRRAYAIDHGRRYVTRVITVATHREASDLRTAILAGPPESLRSRFAEAAVSSSTDPSGGAGGLLGALSPEDTTLPASLRDALTSTAPGSVSAVLALDTSFAIAMVESVVEPSGVPYESVLPTLEVSVRDRLERLQMDVIAQEMLGGARISVFDRSLNWGWEAGRGR